MIQSIGYISYYPPALQRFVTINSTIFYHSPFSTSFSSISYKNMTINSSQSSISVNQSNCFINNNYVYNLAALQNNLLALFSTRGSNACLTETNNLLVYSFNGTLQYVNNISAVFSPILNILNNFTSVKVVDSLYLPGYQKLVAFVKLYNNSAVRY